MKYNIGDTVLVRASVYTKEHVGRQLAYPHHWPPENVTNHPYKINVRDLRRVIYKEPFEAIVLGWSTRLSGYISSGSLYYDGEYEQGFFDTRKVHKVIMVAPKEGTRWSQPFPCLEKDLEPITEMTKFISQMITQTTRFNVNGNNGGDYIDIALIESPDEYNQILHVEVGKSCVTILNKDIPVEALAFLIYEYSDVLEDMATKIRKRWREK